MKVQITLQPSTGKMSRKVKRCRISHTDIIGFLVSRGEIIARPQ